MTLGVRADFVRRYDVLRSFEIEKSVEVAPRLGGALLLDDAAKNVVRASFARVHRQLMGGRDAVAAFSGNPTASSKTIDLGIDVLGFVGHFFSFGLAQLAFGLAIIKVPNISNWLGGLSFVPAFMLGWMVPLLALLGQDARPVMGIGIAVFFIWLVGMSVVLLRWKEPEEP